MRLNSITLVWFRGAADPVTLDLNSKSMVVYGENGSGKSSFVDSVEYVLNGGKIGHLSHEYSGRHQEKGIINTHTPAGKKTEIRFKFGEGSEQSTHIKRNGSFVTSGAEAVAMASWDYRRTVLRQDEVASFIRDTKGVKYSALLPLLGLDKMEVAAENLRQLVKAVAQESGVEGKRLALKRLEPERKKVFGDAADYQIAQKICDLHKCYCTDVAGADAAAQCDEVEKAIDKRIGEFSSAQRKQYALQGVTDLNLKSQIDAVRSVDRQLTEILEPIIQEKLDLLEEKAEVLRVACDFAGKLKEEQQEVRCPACGRSIPVEAFRAHVTAEKKHYQRVIEAYGSRRKQVINLSGGIKNLKTSLGKAEVKSWREDISNGSLAENFSCLDRSNPETLQSECTEEDLKKIELDLIPLVDAAALELKNPQPDVQQLSTDKRLVDIGRRVVNAQKDSTEVAQAEALIGFLTSLEQGIRKEIRLRSQKVIEEISSDIQRMWEILHPEKSIEDVHLYLPEDADKAIDIELKFHGVEQDSPRLTLSEGNRNSLGLCIFLAMAKRETDKHRPLFLDDVVISLDRNHRGMIFELLEREFNDRQVIIFTHDREWFTELRHQFEVSNWAFKVLMPYEKPDIGIRWSSKASTFDDARALIKGAPDSAGNTARKIMDIELALCAERLKIRLPYMHRERNDHRTAHDFLLRLIADGEKCFRKKNARTGEYEAYMEAVEVFRDAHKLILAWSDRASHTFDMGQPEAEKLIAVCEKSLEVLTCPDCKKSVYRLEDKSTDRVQCGCGLLEWRYGKA